MITSRDNEKLKLVRKLHERRWRDKLGLFFVEGEDLVESALAVGLEPVELLVAGETVAPALLAEVSTLAHPPRVIAVFAKPALPASTAAAPTLALWRVSDPGNVGTLLRSADAFGARVALSAGCADVYGPKALRAAMGSTFRAPFVEFAVGAGAVALVPGDAPPLHELELSHETTFVLGSERDGLPEELLAQCERRATIPHLRADMSSRATSGARHRPRPEATGRSSGPESLNVAMAGTIALYELSRRG